MIIRFTRLEDSDATDSTAMVVTKESQFRAEFNRKNNDPFWSSIECMQTCVKSNTGLGKYLYVPFRVRIQKRLVMGGTDLEKDINYDYRGIGTEYEKDIIKFSEI